MCRVVVTGVSSGPRPAGLATTSSLRAAPDPKTKLKPPVHPAHSLQVPPCAPGHLAGVLHRPSATA